MQLSPLQLDYNYVSLNNNLNSAKFYKNNEKIKGFVTGKTAKYRIPTLQRQNKGANPMNIQPLTSVSAAQYELLLSADPSPVMVASYVNRAFKFAAQIDHKLVGVLLLLPTHPRTLEIVNLAISQRQQNQGIGTQLLQFAENWAHQKHYRTLEIATGSTSFGPLYLYQKQGFRITSIERNFFSRHYPQTIWENKLILKDLIRLQKTLQ